MQILYRNMLMSLNPWLVTTSRQHSLTPFSSLLIVKATSNEGFSAIVLLFALDCGDYSVGLRLWSTESWKDREWTRDGC